MAKKTSQGMSIDVHNKINPKELKKLIEISLDAIEADPKLAATIPPLLVHGSPGAGKSSIVRQICEERNLNFVDVRLSQLEPADLKGLPVPNREKNCMDWMVNGSWPREGKGIIFLDELTSASKDIQVAAYELVLDRRLGKLYDVPSGYYIMAAGNNTTDAAVATTMSSALANRFMHVELDADPQAWLEWALENQIHPSVTGYIRWKPQHLFDMDDQNLERGWPSPRSWHRVSQMCHICADTSILRKMVYGLIGDRVGSEFMAFYNLNANFDDVLRMMTDPKARIEIPTEAQMVYSLSSTMVYLLWQGKDEKDEDARLDGYYRICMKMTPDFAAMTMQAAMVGNSKERKAHQIKKLVHHKSFEEWRELHGAALTKHTKMFNTAISA